MNDNWKDPESFPIDSIRIEATGIMGPPAERGPHVRLVVNEGAPTETSFKADDLSPVFLSALLHECRDALTWRARLLTYPNAPTPPRCATCGIGPASTVEPPSPRDEGVL